MKKNLTKKTEKMAGREMLQCHNLIESAYKK